MSEISLNYIKERVMSGSKSGVLEMTEVQQRELLAKLMAEKAKASDRAKKYREENKEKCNAWSERARVRATILCKKAKDAGIEVSDAEVDAYIANMSK
jgi:hypothetical protein